MLIVLSPAKKLDPAPRTAETTAPIFPEATAELVAAARALGIEDLRRLMSISEPLARLNRDRFRDWATAPETPAIHAFAGDTYTGLDAATLSEDALRRADGHLRILSGLYGLLRPMDALRPYRLEMGSRLAGPWGRDLYAFWGDRIARALNQEAEAVGARMLLNCASREYFDAVDRTALTLPVVTPTFLEDKPGGPKIVSFHAKQARGAMARFVVENRIDDPADLRAFDAGGYTFQPDRSTPEAPVFLRPDQARKAA
ncbi:peroxide stress protein YaaA [uncultured Jannaschia sp.]|uniref:peroxide stress protein YaaA n=1 Tax=uncultured Jannaschia sp. TaxID=293347 RepID=UPI002621008E|nr:peroxide stress protein YaaA [uncultured Jannaschia sp.]